MQWLRNETRARRFAILKTYFELYSKFRTHTVQLDSKFGKKRPMTPVALTAFINAFMIFQKVDFLVCKHFEGIIQSDSFFCLNFLVLLSAYGEMLPLAI